MRKSLRDLHQELIDSWHHAKTFKTGNETLYYGRAQGVELAAEALDCSLGDLISDVAAVELRRDPARESDGAQPVDARRLSK